MALLLKAVGPTRPPVSGKSRLEECVPICQTAFR